MTDHEQAVDTESTKPNQFKGITDEALEWSLQDWQNALKETKKDVDRYNELIAELEAELEARKLQAWRAAHPELAQVEEGDKILTTPEAIASGGLCDAVGSINTVTKFLIYHGEYGALVHLDASWGEVFKSFEIISQMRSAYLASHESRGTPDDQ